MSRSEKRRAARGEGGSDMTKFYLILGVVAVIGIGAVGYSIGSNALGSAVSEPIELEGMDDQATLVEMAQGVTKGDPDAPVTVVEFGDYQCPGCGGFALSVEPQIDLTLVQSGKVKFVFYDFPLTQAHQHAFLAARASRCALDQDKYWEYHSTLFRNQSTWAAMQNAVGKFIDYSEDVGADRDVFEACLRSDRHADVVSANMRLGYELGVNGTPTIMVNGNGQLRRVNNNDFQSIQAAVDQVMQPAESGN